MNECRGVDELDDRRIEDGHVALRLSAGQPAGHQHHRRPHALAARVLQVLANLRDQLDTRVDVPQECLVDAFKVFPEGSNSGVRSEGDEEGCTCETSGISTHWGDAVNARLPVGAVVAEHCCGVGEGLGRSLWCRQSSHSREHLEDAGDPSRFVWATSLGRQRQVRAVGLDQPAVRRDRGRHGT